MTGAPYPITLRQLDRLRELLAEAHTVARSIRESGPVFVRFEASNMVGCIDELGDLVREALQAISTGEA